MIDPVDGRVFFIDEVNSSLTTSKESLKARQTFFLFPLELLHSSRYGYQIYILSSLSFLLSDASSLIGLANLQIS